MGADYSTEDEQEFNDAEDIDSKLAEGVEDADGLDTPYGKGTILRKREDGFLEVQLDFGTAYLQDPRSMDEVLEALFKKFDVDSNDALEGDEVKNLLADCKIQLSEDEFSDLWTDADKDDDGKISLQELKQIYAKLIEDSKLKAEVAGEGAEEVPEVADCHPTEPEAAPAKPAVNVKASIKALTKNEFTPELARESMKEIMNGQATDAQLGAYLALLTLDKCTSDVVSALADEMRKAAEVFPGDTGCMDIVGTGGDGKNTFNISTSAMFIIAAAGIPVTKHGNNAASSRSGSADLLTSLGAELQLDPAQTKQVFDDAGMCFLYAKFHPAMRHVGPARKEMGIRTVFNILGPLTNPARPKYQMTGVFSEEIGQMYIESLKEMGVENSMVVCGKEGLDEISIAGPTAYWQLSKGEITTGVLMPEHFGVVRKPLNVCFSGSPEENAEKLKAIFEGEEGPVTEFILINAAAALKVAGKAATWKEGMTIARETISSGKALATLNAFVKATQNASNSSKFTVLDS